MTQLRRVAIIGGNRIPFARSNGPYATASNQAMLTAALEGLIEDAIAKDAKLNLEFDRAQFKKIFEEQMAAFSQQ